MQDDEYGAENGDENVAWPSYVDFLSTFTFVLFIFIGSLLFILYGQLPERMFQMRMETFMKQLEVNGTPATIDGHRVRWDLRRQLDFAPSSAVLNEKHKTYLRKIAQQLPQGLKDGGDCRIVVLGTADSTPFANDPFGNWNLSSQRALRVLEFLHQCADCGYGLEMRRRLTLLGEGDTRADKNRAADDDRRVDLILDCSIDTEVRR